MGISKWHSCGNIITIAHRVLNNLHYNDFITLTDRHKGEISCDLFQAFKLETNVCILLVDSNCLSHQLNQLEVRQLLQSRRSPQLELQLQANRTTVLLGLSTTDSRLPTMDKGDRHLDRYLLHSRVSR